MKSFLDRFRTRARPAKDSRDSRSPRTIDELSALVAGRPGDWSIENDLADALIAAGRLDEAVTRLCATGDRLAADQFTAQAVALYRKALRLRPRNEYAAQRVTMISAERISQAGLRLGGGMTAVRTVEGLSAPEPQESSEVALPDYVEAPQNHSVTAETFAGDDIPQATDAEPVDASNEPFAESAKSIEEIVADADFAATYGGLNTAIKMLMECARMHPDRIEPVAKLAEIADLARLDDLWVDAQARLADFQCRQGDYEAARKTAESLVIRYPDDQRHRARLEFIVGELGDTAPSDAIEQAATDVLQSDTPTVVDVEADVEAPEPIDPDAQIDLDFQRAMEAMLGSGGEGDQRDLAEARAALERATAVSRHRVAASRQLAALDAEAGEWASALRWLECAAVEPLSTAEEEELAYDMAVLLERAGEWDRALGVFSEIAAKVGAEYRDVSARILRLSSMSGAARPAEQLVAS